MRISKKNYFSPEANSEFMSVSQYKSFCKCEAAALAEIKGEYIRPESRALLLGSYVDEMLTGTKKSKEAFLLENNSELFKKNGEPYADVQKAMDAVAKVKEQPLMMKYLSGQKQKIMTGEISGIPFKIKMDSYKKNEFIADLKYMASLRSPNMFEPMVKYWNYVAQGAVYQEIVFQNTGKRLPFYLVIATKEDPTHLAVCEIKQYDLDDELDKIKATVGRYHAIKQGEIEPERCEEYDCIYCTSTHVITEPIDSNYLGMSKKQIQAANGDFF